MHDQHDTIKRIGSISETPDVSDLDVGNNVAFVSNAIMISIVLLPQTGDDIMPTLHSFEG